MLKVLIAMGMLISVCVAEDTPSTLELFKKKVEAAAGDFIWDHHCFPMGLECGKEDYAHEVGKYHINLGADPKNAIEDALQKITNKDLDGVKENVDKLETFKYEQHKEGYEYFYKYDKDGKIAEKIKLYGGQVHKWLYDTNTGELKSHSTTDIDGNTVQKEGTKVEEKEDIFNKVVEEKIEEKTAEERAKYEKYLAYLKELAAKETADNAEYWATKPWDETSKYPELTKVTEVTKEATEATKAEETKVLTASTTEAKELTPVPNKERKREELKEATEADVVCKEVKGDDGTVTKVCEKVNGDETITYKPTPEDNETILQKLKYEATLEERKEDGELESYIKKYEDEKTEYKMLEKIKEETDEAGTKKIEWQLKTIEKTKQDEDSDGVARAIVKTVYDQVLANKEKCKSLYTSKTEIACAVYLGPDPVDKNVYKVGVYANQKYLKEGADGVKVLPDELKAEQVETRLSGILSDSSVEASQVRAVDEQNAASSTVIAIMSVVFAVMMLF